MDQKYFIHASSCDLFRPGDIGAIGRKRKTSEPFSEVTGEFENNYYYCEESREQLELGWKQAIAKWGQVVIDQKKKQTRLYRELCQVTQPALCAFCQAFDLDALFTLVNGKIPTRGEAFASLGNFWEGVEKHHCPLCELFASVCYKDSLDFMNKRTRQLRVYNRRHRQSSVECPSFLGLPLDYKFDEDHGEDLVKEVGLMGFIIPVQTSRSFNTTVQLVNSQHVDFQLLSSWLVSCETEHTDCRLQGISQEEPGHLRAIDCHKGIVVPIKHGDPYLALSYVWGLSQPQLAEGLGAVSNSDTSCQTLIRNAPLTIQDAIATVRRLGMQYLWVDRYCINEDDPEDKKALIHNMDYIYENAVATIVALHGDNDRTGLPGVSTTHRTKQRFYCSQDKVLVSTLPKIEGLLRDSKWSSRAWTYQEARLSRRCIFFTNYQVYFVCRSGTLSESIPAILDTEIAKLMNLTRLNVRLFLSLRTPVYHDDLFMDRKAYSCRHLTYDLDALNAFRGILKRSPWRSFYGVEILPIGSIVDPNLGLASGMSWISAARSFSTNGRRRSGFPTWSWASIVGEIDDWRPFSTGLGPTTPQFWITSPTAQFTPLSVALQKASSMMLPEISPRIMVEGEIVKTWIYKFSAGRTFRFEPGSDQAIDGEVHLDIEGPECEVPSHGGFSDALVLWETCEKHLGTTTLLALQWIDPRTAKRIGLLQPLSILFSATDFANVPRTKRQFVLE